MTAEDVVPSERDRLAGTIGANWWRASALAETTGNDTNYGPVVAYLADAILAAGFSYRPPFCADCGGAGVVGETDNPDDYDPNAPLCPTCAGTGFVQ